MGDAETYTELRLAGQPDGDYPYYDHKCRDGDKGADDLRMIWARIRSGEYPWTDTRLTTRQVTVTPWVDPTEAEPWAPQSGRFVEWRVVADFEGVQDFEYIRSRLREPHLESDDVVEAVTRKFVTHFQDSGHLRDLTLTCRTVTMTPWEDATDG